MTYIKNSSKENTTGNIAGNNTTNRAIPHGLGVTPKFMFMWRNEADVRYILKNDQFCFLNEGVSSALSVTAMDDTNFYVGNPSNYSWTGNATGSTYYWVCFP